MFYNRFLERLGLYLLVGPAVAAAAIYVLGVIFAVLSQKPPPALDRETWLLVGSIYFVAFPIVAFYAFSIGVVLVNATRVRIHVTICSLMISLIVLYPVLLAMTWSGGPVRNDVYWRGFALSFFPILLAGLVCWRIAPGLHRSA